MERVLLILAVFFSGFVVGQKLPIETTQADPDLTSSSVAQLYRVVVERVLYQGVKL